MVSSDLITACQLVKSISEGLVHMELGTAPLIPEAISTALVVDGAESHIDWNLKNCPKLALTFTKGHICYLAATLG